MSLLPDLLFFVGEDEVILDFLFGEVGTLEVAGYVLRLWLIRDHLFDNSLLVLLI